MPTQNRRVAAYLPKELDDRLKAFIAERGLKGDSPALLAILSEYFGVAHPSAQQVDYSGFVKIEQFQELADKVSELAERVERGSSVGGLLSKLPDKMRQIAERLDKVEASAMLTSAVEPALSLKLVESVPGQMNLLGSVASEPQVSQNSSLSNEESDTGVEPCNGHKLSKRFGLAKDSVAGAKRKRSPEEFLRWMKEKDPDGIAWRYDPEDKLYHPIIDSSPVSLGESFI